MTHVRILAGDLTACAGSQTYHRQLANRLAERGHRVSIVCFQASDDVRDCAEVVELPLVTYDQCPVIWRFTSLLQMRDSARELRRARLDAPGVVIAGEHLFAKAHAQAFPQCPVVYLPHSLIVSHEIDGYNLPPAMSRVTHRIYRHLQRWALANTARTLRFTQTACDILADEYGLPRDARFVVNPIGIDIPSWELRQRQPGPTRLLYVGQLIPRKRVHLILEALTRCRSDNWELDIVGSGSTQQELDSLASQHQMNERVRFHGFQTNVERWYKNSDLLILPSRSESLGLVLLEAMSHGLPCLAFRPDGIDTWNVNEEIIQHNRTGILADDFEHFCRQMDQAVEKPERLLPLGRAARESVVANHSWDVHLDRYEALFDELASPHAPSETHGLQTVLDG